MTALRSIRRFVGLSGAAGILLTAALLLAACAGGEGPGWTFAPLGPTQSPSGSPGASPGGSPGASPGGSPAGSPGSSPAGSPGGSPAGSPGGSPATGTALQISTPGDQPLAFVPNQLSAPAATNVTVEYLNDSNLLHNIHFFAGPDASAQTIAATEIVTGPGNLQTVSFTTPAEPGQYFFHCDVHPPDMTGTLTVSP